MGEVFAGWFVLNLLLRIPVISALSVYLARKQLKETKSKTSTKWNCFTLFLIPQESVSIAFEVFTALELKKEMGIQETD
jgi:hypothetical protein